MVLCGGVAMVTLTLGAIGMLPSAVRRIGAVDIPIPTRPIIAVLVMASIMAVPARPRTASATVAPPVVRLTDAAEAEGDDPASGSATDTRQATVQLDRARTPYIVQSGDCLWRIAREALAARGVAEPSSIEIARFWPVIYDANRSLIGDDPNLIYPGQSLQIPEV